MLLTLALLLLQQSTQASCPNLAGRYVIQGEDGRVFVTIAQARCERVNLTWLIHSLSDSSKTTHSFTPDGVFRSDTAWYGERGRQLTSAVFRPSEFELVARRPNTPGNRGFRWKQTFSLLPTGDLCIITQDAKTTRATIAGRQTREGRSGEDEAADKSGFRNAC
jgi:hypothetical protein